MKEVLLKNEVLLTKEQFQRLIENDEVEEGVIYNIIGVDKILTPVYALPIPTEADIGNSYLLMDETSENYGHVFYVEDTLVLTDYGSLKGSDSVYDDNLLSLERLSDYLYKITFNTLPPEEELNIDYSFGCTSFVRDGKLYRNLDWDYNTNSEFRVVCKNFEGMSFLNNLNDGDITKDKLTQLPYHIVDGRNTSGIMVSTHVLYNDWNYTGAGTKTNVITKIPFLVLNTITDIDDLDNIQPYLNNIKVSGSSPYLIQVLVTDGTTTKLITPPTSDNTAYQIIDITANPKLTNFKWVNRTSVVRTEADIQTRPTGIERWNLINNTVTLEDLKFTKCYTSPNRLSEFIGLRDTDKNSTDAQLEAIYDEAHELYLERERDGQTWHTMHSIVYSNKGIEELYIQEDFNRNYAGGGGSADVPFDISISNPSTTSLSLTDTTKITSEGSYPWVVMAHSNLGNSYTPGNAPIARNNTFSTNTFSKTKFTFTALTDNSTLDFELHSDLGNSNPFLISKIDTELSASTTIDDASLLEYQVKSNDWTKAIHYKVTGIPKGTHFITLKLVITYNDPNSRKAFDFYSISLTNGKVISATDNRTGQSDTLLAPDNIKDYGLLDTHVEDYNDFNFIRAWSKHVAGKTIMVKYDRYTGTTYKYTEYYYPFHISSTQMSFFRLCADTINPGTSNPFAGVYIYLIARTSTGSWSYATKYFPVSDNQLNLDTNSLTNDVAHFPASIAVLKQLDIFAEQKNLPKLSQLNVAYKIPFYSGEMDLTSLNANKTITNYTFNYDSATQSLVNNNGTVSESLAYIKITFNAAAECDIKFTIKLTRSYSSYGAYNYFVISHYNTDIPSNFIYDLTSNRLYVGTYDTGTTIVTEHIPSAGTYYYTIVYRNRYVVSPGDKAEITKIELTNMDTSSIPGYDPTAKKLIDIDTGEEISVGGGTDITKEKWGYDD